MKIRDRLIKWLGGTPKTALVEYLHSNINFTPVKSVVIIDHPADEARAQHEIARQLGDFLYDNFLISFDATPVDNGTTRVEGSIYIGKKEG